MQPKVVHEPAQSGWELRDALREVRRAGCPACRAGGTAEQQWVTFYAIENHGDVGVMQRLRASRGFCAPHTRAVLAHESASTLLTRPLADLVGDLAGDVDGQTRDICPLCDTVSHAEQLAITRLLRWWAKDEVRSTLRTTGGLCWEHLADALSACPSSLLPLVLADAAAPSEDTDSAAFTMLGDLRPDHRRRAPLVISIARQLGMVPSNPVAELYEDVARSSCPTCQVHGRAAVRFLRWLCELPSEAFARLDAFDVSLCVDHLADLATLCAGRAAAIGRARRRLLHDPLTILAAEAGDVASGRLGRKIFAAAATLLAPRPFPAAPSQPRNERGSRLTASRTADIVARSRSSLHPCPVCRAAAEAAERRTALLAAQIDDAPFRAALLASHGPCLPHGMQLRRLRPDPQVSTLIRARVSTLRWQLDEAVRKQSWRARHEPVGTESTAWWLAPTWITAHVYLGVVPGNEHLIPSRTRVKRDNVRGGAALTGGQ